MDTRITKIEVLLTLDGVHMVRSFLRERLVYETGLRVWNGQQTVRTEAFERGATGSHRTLEMTHLSNGKAKLLAMFGENGSFEFASEVVGLLSQREACGVEYGTIELTLESAVASELPQLLDWKDREKLYEAPAQVE